MYPPMVKHGLDFNSAGKYEGTLEGMHFDHRNLVST